jgi:hypothetical protein
MLGEMFRIPGSSLGAIVSHVGKEADCDQENMNITDGTQLRSGISCCETTLEDFRHQQISGSQDAFSSAAA